MTEKDVYQQLFDKYARVPGIPEMAGSFMELLRLQFTPEEAELALKVGARGRKLSEIQESTGMGKGKLKGMLNTMADKGTMWISPGQKDPDYKTIGIAGPGLLETGGWGNVRFPHSVQLMKALHQFQIDFSRECLPRINFPVQVWLTPAALPDDADPTENVAEMIKGAGHWGVSTCSCRLPHWVANPGNHCHHLLETCLFMGDMARWGVEHGMCRKITYKEAVELLRKCNEDGLVHSYDPNDFICNCCSDCCVFHVGIRQTGAKLLQPSHFVAQIDDSTCQACSTCADRCPMGAIEVNDHASVNEDKCIGCGVCFPTCPSDSIRFIRR
jgi:NAD-dependent dihydropyrimidine dehydrogenase PreA subunit